MAHLLNTSQITHPAKTFIAHSKLLNCNPRHVTAYVLNGLGALYLHLEHFPESDFLYLSKQMFRALHEIAL